MLIERQKLVAVLWHHHKPILTALDDQLVPILSNDSPGTSHLDMACLASYPRAFVIADQVFPYHYSVRGLS